jgi:hypothetical protein
MNRSRSGTALFSRRSKTIVKHYIFWLKCLIPEPLRRMIKPGEKQDNVNDL